MDLDCHVYCICVIILGIICRYHVDAEAFVLCEDESKEIQCGVGQIIKIQTMEQEKLHSSCESLDKENCTQDFTKIIDSCNGQQNCTLNGTDFSSGICKVYPRYVSVTYKCSENFYSRDVCLTPMNISCNNSIDIGNTDKSNDQRTTATIISDIESTVVKNSGRPVFPCLSGTPRFPNVTGTLPPIDMSKTIPEVNDNPNITGNRSDQRPTLNSDIESTAVIKGSDGSPDLPGLNGTQIFPNVSGVSPTVNLSDTTVPDVNNGMILASCGGIVLLAVIVVSTFCFIKQKRANSRRIRDTYTGLSFHATGTGNTGRLENVDMGTQDGGYSELSLLQSTASNSTTQPQGNSDYESPDYLVPEEIHINEHSSAELSIQDGEYAEIL